MQKELKVGQSVVFYDSLRIAHEALVTMWFSDTCCNVVYVSKDEKKNDSYGYQLERYTSTGHKKFQGDTIFGNCWCWPDEL